MPILAVDYTAGSLKGTINVYPTLQFLYSHHIHQEYITEDVKRAATDFKNSNLMESFEYFLEP